jgi:hypothetical protein
VHDCLRPKATRCVSQTSWRGDRRGLSRVGRGSPRAPASFCTEPISGRHPSFATLQETSNRQPFYRLLPCTPSTSFATIPVHNVGAELVRRRKQGGEYLLRPIWPGRPGSKCSIRPNWSFLKTQRLKGGLHREDSPESRFARLPHARSATGGHGRSLRTTARRSSTSRSGPCPSGANGRP